MAMPDRLIKPKEVSLAMMLGANACVLLIGITACFAMFSIWPLSATATALPVNFFVFASFHKRMGSQQYFWFATGLFGALLVVLICLVLITRMTADSRVRAPRAQTGDRPCR